MSNFSESNPIVPTPNIRTEEFFNFRFEIKALSNTAKGSIKAASSKEHFLVIYEYTDKNFICEANAPVSPPPIFFLFLHKL